MINRDLFLRSLTLDWSQVGGDSYLRGIAALRSLASLDFHRRVTFLTGENGSGKSTLLEAIALACGFSGEGGTRNMRVNTYNDVSELSGALRLIRGVRWPAAGFFFRAESFFNVATAITLEYNDGSMPDYHAASHGESFLTFMQTARPDGLYLMDEPEAALSPQRQLTLLIHITELARAGAQLIIATHSPILLGVPEAEILSFGPEGVRPIPYDEAESVQISRLFLDNPARMVRMLMDDAGDSSPRA